MPWPRVVAESLRAIDAPATVCPPDAAPRCLGSIVAQAIAPDCDPATPPGFLLPQQHDPWRRTMATLRGWRGALLAEPVGSGKTWMALAVCAGESPPAVVIAPAILHRQWRDAGRQAGVPITLWSHERCSRGTLPPGNPDLVVIDEAHRFRDPATRRVRTAAPWLTGRRVLLVTATPIVNRLQDLIALLRLALPEDALALDGILELGAMEAMPTPPHALRRVVIRTAATSTASIPRMVTSLPADGHESRRGAVAVATIRQLALSTSAPVRRLIASVLLDAAASSDAALGHALRRYLALLLQARDSGGASRRTLRQFAGESLEQLVLWPLVGGPAPVQELPLDDIERVAVALARPARDTAWIDAVRELTRRTTPTVCFARHRATAAALRRAFGDAAAWITGNCAGIGPHRLSRDSVLEAFGPARGSWTARRIPPDVLVATDVAAEGLDLHAAAQIVHVDLPWTATRVDQREGRLLRIGQQHSQVRIVIRTPSPAVEAALAMHARIRRKRSLGARWMQSITEARLDGRQAPDRVASWPGSLEGGSRFVVIELRRDGRRGAVLMTRTATGAWTICPGGLERFAGAAPGRRDGAVALDPSSAEHAAALRAAIAAQGPPPPSGSTALVARIHRLARREAARRHSANLGQLDRLLRFAVAPPTAGMRMLLACLAAIDDRELLRIAVPRVPESSPPTARILAAFTMQADRPIARLPITAEPTTLVRCPSSRPCSSILTAP